MKIASAVVAVLFVCFAAASDAQTSSVTVTLSNYAFQPSTLMLKAGEPVTLHLVNSAQKSHDFAAPDFFAAAAIAPQDQAKVADGSIELDAGESASVTLTPKAGIYSLTCTHFLHSMLGMNGRIVVK